MTTNTTYVVYVWFNDDWRVHHRYATVLAANNAAAALQRNGKLAYVEID